MLIKLETLCGCIGYREVDEKTARQYTLFVPIAYPNPLPSLKEVCATDLCFTYSVRTFECITSEFDKWHNKRMPVFKEKCTK